MLIGVTSDTHGDVTAWQKALDGPFQGVELILHAGDVLYHGPRNPLVPGYGPANLAEAINASPVPVVIARGNCDSSVDQLVLNFPIQTPYAFVQVDGIRILINHGDELSQDMMLQQAQQYIADIFVFGHIHLPVLEKKNGVTLLNPGSPSLPKSPSPTAATIDTTTRTIRILNLNDNTAILEATF